MGRELRRTAALCLSLTLLAGCGSGDSGDANVERDIRRVEITISVEADRLDDFASLAGTRVMESAVRLPDVPGQ